MTALHGKKEAMAGSHHDIVSMDRSHQFDVTAKPARLLSRCPILGPFFTYNLGRNPKFIVEFKYLGAVDNPNDTPDPRVLPASEVQWLFDLGLEIAGEYVEGGDEVEINLRLTAWEGKTQRYLTRAWPLTGTGRAVLGIGQYPPIKGDGSIYSFDVNDTSAIMTTVLLSLVTGVVGTIIGLLLGRLFASQ